ncbi:MAG TPA: M4 family metallopeptidase [Myxococcaceae bacterium]
MGNRFWKSFCAAWLGTSLAACGSLQQTEELPALPSQHADVQAALSQFAEVQVLGTTNGMPYFIQGQLGHVPRSATRRSGEDFEAIHVALRSIAPVFRLESQDLMFQRATVDAQGHQHLRFQQTLHGLRVVGGELRLHVDTEGLVYAANGSAWSGPNEPAQAKLAAEAARRLAEQGSTALRATAEGSPTLVYLHPEGAEALRLAWEVRVKGERSGMPADDLLYVDAEHGGVLALHPQHHPVLNRQVYSAGNSTTLPGALVRTEGQAATGDAHVDLNHDWLGTTYDCYRTLFGRDSYDNAGSPLVSTVHFGSGYVNAFWDGTQMVFGDGNGVDSGELGRDLDITAHELTHAVTDSESALLYSGESGGLNESLSDIFASVCESWTRGWATDADVFKVAEDVWTPNTAGDALRYMTDPAQDGSSLDYYGDYLSGTEVHYSSGISNLAFALLSRGGTHPRGKTNMSVAAIGPEKAGRIFYKASTDLFTASTTFDQARAYTVQAAQALGYDTATVQAVSDAWRAVGVPSETSPTSPLTNGVALSSLFGGTGTQKYFTLEVPAGSTSLRFETSGGTGDVDLYVRYGSQPATNAYDCRPYASGNTETCSFTNPQAGTWHVMLYGYTSYSGVSLKGTHGGSSGGGTPITETATGTVSKGSQVQLGTFNVVPGTAFRVEMTGTRNPDLYVRFGAAPTTRTYDCRPALSGATETCALTVPAGQRTAYIMVRGAGSGTASYTLTISYTRP